MFGTAAVLLVIAVVGKLCSVVGLIGSPGDRLLVGIGMIPRGEVGLIFATLGLNQHVFGQDVYAALLLVVLVTTVGDTARPALAPARDARRGNAATPAAASSAGVALVHVGEHGLVELDAEPLPSDALVVALHAARLCAEHRPSAGLARVAGGVPARSAPLGRRRRARSSSTLLREGGAAIVADADGVGRAAAVPSRARRRVGAPPSATLRS